SSNADATVAPGSGVKMEHRVNTGDASTIADGQDGTGGVMVAPYWVRVTRVGSTFLGERSADGTTWVPIQNSPAVTLSVGSPIYIGLPVCSHVAGTLRTATFDNVTLTTPPTAVADSYSVNE